MKKLLTGLALGVLVLGVSVSSVVAQRGQQGTGQAVDQETTGQGQSRGIQAAGESLSRVAQRVNNPETGEQVRAMVENHEKVQTRTKTALQNMDKRNQAVRLIAGPDYKNAGQVRSDVVGLRNDIRQLDGLQEEMTEDEAGEVQRAIDELRTEADELEAQLVERTSGFSLFGWLGRLLNKY